MRTTSRLHTRVPVVVAVLAFAFMTCLVQAVPITFQFTGEITSIYDPSRLLGSRIAIGDHYAGKVVFESTTPDSVPSNPTVGRYESPGGSFDFQVGEIQIHTGTPRIIVENNPFGDGLSIGSHLPIELTDFRIIEFSPVSLDGTASVFSDDSLPLVPPLLSGFLDARFWMQAASLDENRFFVVEGRVETLTPEPSSFLIACACLGLLTRRACGLSPAR